MRIDCDRFCAVVGFVDADEPIGQFEHVVSKRDDDELGVLCSLLMTKYTTLNLFLEHICLNKILISHNYIYLSISTFHLQL